MLQKLLQPAGYLLRLADAVTRRIIERSFAPRLSYIQA